MNSKIEKINQSVKGLIPVNIKLDLTHIKSMPFQIDGQCPTYIAKLNEGVDSKDMKMGDYIIDINGQNVSRASRKSVEKLINRHLSESKVLHILLYRRSRKTSSKMSTNNNTDISTNTINEPVNLLSCFKKALLFTSNTKKSNKVQKKSLVNKTAETNVSNTVSDLKYTKVEAVKTSEPIVLTEIPLKTLNRTNSDSDDYGYYSIPQESQSNETISESSISFENESELLDTSILSSIDLFIHKLQNLIEAYIRPLIALNILNKKEYLILFQNMEKLVPVTKYLYNIIETNDYSNSLKIVFETFETYLYGLPNAMQCLEELLAYHEEFYLFLKTLKDSCKMALFDFIFLPFKFVKLICSYFNEKTILRNDQELYKLNKTLIRTMNFLNEITTNEENETTFNSTIFTESSINVVKKPNLKSNEILFQDNIMFKSSDKSEWKKAKIVLFSDKIVILNKSTQKVYKSIKLDNIKTIKKCLNSSLDIDLLIKEDKFIKVQFGNMLSKNIWFQLTQIQLNYY